jgi:hypothetical protein
MKMMRRIITAALVLILALPVLAQKKDDKGLKREVTLYNPYKPSLPDVVKKSYLPEMTDTAGVKPKFSYQVKTYPFTPSYSINPVKPAALLPDPLPKLYKSYVNFGFGTYITPLAEVSITSLRSKKGSAGFYARHLSTNGNIGLEDGQKAFAGYMDNDASLYGRKFLKGAILSGSADFNQKTRYAYGHDTAFTSFSPSKKELKLNYLNAGARIGIESTGTDSSSFAYNFQAGYNYFTSSSLNTSGKSWNQNNFNIHGRLSREISGFYAGALLDLNLYKPSDSISVTGKYIASVNPFVTKSTKDWNLKLGFTALLDKDYAGNTDFHIYPDVSFGFSIIPTYLGFFADLSGRLQDNNPLTVVEMNPYLLPGKTLYNTKNTSYDLSVMAGLKGESGIGGNYSLHASYSVVNDLLMFTNYELIDNTSPVRMGQFFLPVTDDANILNVHGDLSGRLAQNITFETVANYYGYTMNNFASPWNLPSWDGSLKLKYNLRDKIIAGASVNALGERNLYVTRELLNPAGNASHKVSLPAAVNLSLSAEYRYTKILSFWVKFNNISFSKYYEWAYFPSQRFIFMAGFSYSL